MTRLLKAELGNIYSFLRTYRSEAVVIGMATLCLTLNRYHQIQPQWASPLIYYAALPILTIVLLLRKNPLDFGFRLGEWRTWGLYVAITFLIGLPILYAASRVPSVVGYYNLKELNLTIYSLETLAILFSWEYLLRGFLLFGLREKFKEASILVQVVPFVLLHFGKPEIETISTIITGVYFGYVAYRGKSFWPALIIHYFINIMIRVFVNLL